MIWKLLRQHISIPQFTGFFLANLCGMAIVLLGVQFYRDVLPIFTQGDSFMKKDFVVVSKKVSTLGTFVGRSSTFSIGDMEEMKQQPFVKQVGAFTPAQFHVSAGIGIQGVNMSTDMFFESVPDAYLDVKLDKWHFAPEDGVVPIIIPRNYLNLYNFGFAQSRNLPQLSEGIMGMMNLNVRITGKGQSVKMKGNIVGFSNRLNTILVPEDFIVWANKQYGENSKAGISRLIVELNNPADERIIKFFSKKGYEIEGNDLDVGKTTWFLKLTTGIVSAVGLLISILSFYILMLSIYLLLQKNATKMENLLLLGYSPARVARPYQALTVLLNVCVLLMAIGSVWGIRSVYLSSIKSLFPDGGAGTLWPSITVGVVLLFAVSLLNIWAIRRKVDGIWSSKR